MASRSRWRLLVVYVCYFQLLEVQASQEVMEKLTTGFAKALSECKRELNFGDHIMQDFFNYWKEEYELVNRELGCAIMCMAAKHDLISEDMKLHHDNAHAFAKTHGADDDLAKQLVTMIHECETNAEQNDDDCAKTLNIAKCFRTKIHQLQWAPSMEAIIAEVITDI